MKYRNVTPGSIFILEIILRENKATSVYTFFGLRRKFLRNNNNIHPLRPEMERKDLLAKKCLLLYFLWQITYLGYTLENTNMVHFWILPWCTRYKISWNYKVHIVQWSPNMENKINWVQLWQTNCTDVY